jgi:hypothetical protein
MTDRIQAAQTDEEYVRAHYGKDLPREISFVRLDIDGWSGEVNWFAAAEFTRQREEEIRRLRADIKWTTDARIVGPTLEYDMDSKRRTLARLQRDLTALLKGWREQEDKNGN